MKKPNSIDPLVERLIPLKEVPRLLPRRNGRNVHYQTVWRWTNRGVRGVVLETVRLGHIRYTSQEALQRFASRYSPAMPVGDYHDRLERDLSRTGF